MTIIGNAYKGAIGNRAVQFIIAATIGVAAIYLIDSILVGPLFALVGIGAVAGIGLLASGSLVTGLAPFLIVAAVLLGVFGAFRRTDAFKEIRTDLEHTALNRLRQNETVAGLMRRAGISDPHMEGQIPYALLESRYELFTLWNYLLRLETYEEKFKQLKQIQSDVLNHERRFGSQGITLQEIHDSMKKLIEGDISSETGANESESSNIGWARQDDFIHRIMRELKEDLERYDLSVRISPNIPRQKDEWYDAWLRRNAHYRENVKRLYGQYKARVKNFASYHFIRAQGLKFLHNYVVDGLYKRGYLFAKSNAVPLVCVCNTFAVAGGSRHEIDWSSLKVHHPGDPEHSSILARIGIKSSAVLEEVDIFGYSIADINRITNEGGEAIIRKFLKHDIILFPRENNASYVEVLDWALMEYQSFIDDIRTGKWHPYSRTFDFYAETIENYSNNFSDVAIPDFEDEGSDGEFNPYVDVAYDREALKNPGLFVYRAKKHVSSLRDDVLLEIPRNPYPTLSVEGLWKFISETSRVALEEGGVANHSLEKIRLGFGNIEEAEIQGGQNE